jgi:hypothetical protein
MTQATIQNPATTPLLNIDGVINLFAQQGAPMSKRGFNYGVKAGTLPQPIRITPMRPVWRAADIHSFIQAL